MTKKALAFKFCCEDCGYVPEVNKDQSTDNWKVIPTKCPKCSGRVKIKFNKENI